METLIIDGATVAAVVVAFCTGSVLEPLREWAHKYCSVLACPFCFTWWVALLVDPSPTYLATVTFGSIGVMLIHWSIATYQTEEDQT